VCSAWPYVNTIPHLGTFIQLLSADVFSRYLRLKGDEFISVSGSDEHGTPIEVEAIKAGIPPKQLTDKYHKTICELLEKYGVNLTNYTRTHNPVHIRVVQDICRKIYENGYIFEETTTLPYCVKCGRFLPDRFVEGQCPHCDYESARGDQCESCGRILEPLELKNARCVICGTKPETRSSKHWLFDLPKLEDGLRSYLEKSTQFPSNARNFSIRWLEEGLKPRALTRDNKWGIPAPFPGAEDKTIYVWIEAVLGYVTAAVEWAEKIGKPEEWKRFWFDKSTRNVHFIGKDNIPFHTIILPALLMATSDKYVLPWQVSSTEFILYESQKFSKSRRIGVWVDEALEIAAPDYWRFILIAMRPESKDANFTWQEFESLINSGLNDAIGNFINRTLTFIAARYGGDLPNPDALDETDNHLMDEIRQAPIRIGDHFENFRLREALLSIVEIARNGNQYMSSREPWHLLKTDEKKAATTLYVAVQLVYALGILLEPFMPHVSGEILSQLGLEKETLPGMWDKVGVYLIHPGHRIGKPEPLFRKVDATDIQKRTHQHN
jgi:methionyl-tRNA synthetase